MKNIILILLVLICSKGFGQSGETLHIKNPASFVIHGSQITTTPVLTLSAANVIYTGGRDTATPKFRKLVSGDIPTNNVFHVSGSQITSQGTFKLSLQDTIRIIMLCKDIIIWNSKQIKQ